MFHFDDVVSGISKKNCSFSGCSLQVCRNTIHFWALILYLVILLDSFMDSLGIFMYTFIPFINITLLFPFQSGCLLFLFLTNFYPR